MKLNIVLRTFLFACSLLVLFFVIRRIRRSGLEITDSIFWLATAFVLIVIAVFPEMAYQASHIFGFDAPVNFVFACGIIILLVRTFMQDQKICQLKKKVISLTQTDALRNIKKDHD